MTDMVKIEATRDPDPGDDQRKDQRKLIVDWFDINKHRISVRDTDAGKEYLKAMVNWTMGGGHPDLKPSWSGRGDASLLNILETAEAVVSDNESVVMLVDDRRARAALTQAENVNLDIMSTESFVRLLEDHFDFGDAADLWHVIELAAGVNEHGKSRVPDPPKEDPLFVRRPKV